MKTLSNTPITDSSTVHFREDTAGEPPALIPYVPAGTAAQLERRMRELETVLRDTEDRLKFYFDILSSIVGDENEYRSTLEGEITHAVLNRAREALAAAITDEKGNVI